jgi:alkanesulfonate monooxygenase SsuD/methylene tetrahydromethanopterin reductase-like flavin-dependent oxidoreductase (luciferase family)
MLKYSIAGSPETVRRELEGFIRLTNADELMIVTSIYDHRARVRSYEIIAGAWLQSTPEQTDEKLS